MPTRKQPYTHLAGRWGGVRMTRHTLWLGPDHLISVRHHGYTEEYKRFYFSDIRAIIAYRTSRWTFSLLGFGVVGGLLLYVTLLGSLAGWGPVVYVTGLFGVLLTACFSVDLARGPTCVTTLYTAVQAERLHALSRIRALEKALERLHPFVNAAQEDMPPEDKAARYADMETHDRETRSAAARPAVPPPSESRPQRPSPPLPLRAYESRAHAWLFTLLLLDVAHSGSRFAAGGLGLVLIGMFLWIGVLALLTVALVKQHGTDLAPSVKKITWVTLGYVIVAYGLSTAQTLVYTMQHPETASNVFAQAIGMAQNPGRDSVFQAVLLSFSILGSGVLGGLGLLRLYADRRTP